MILILCVFLFFFLDCLIRFCIFSIEFGVWDVFGFLFVFFQAEDGIRDVAVNGVQTCALPISFLECDVI